MKSKVFWTCGLIAATYVVAIYSLMALGMAPHVAMRPFFYAAYYVPPARLLILHQYQRHRHLPEEIDQFFTYRLSVSHGTREWDELLDVYFSQGKMRWASALRNADDGLQQRVIAHIIPTLGSVDPMEALNRMEMIESIRRNDSFVKNGFVWEDFHRSNANAPATFRHDRLASAIDSFQRWWGDGTRWPANKKDDPLAGTGIAILGDP